MMSNDKGMLLKEGDLTHIKLLLLNLPGYTMQGRDKPAKAGGYASAILRS
jgi:hypothetical protein